MDWYITDKEKQAISFLKKVFAFAEMQDKKLILGFSGGKDSIVLLHLAERAGIKEFGDLYYSAFTPIHSVTTVDPPGTIHFIKTNYPQVKIEYPKTNFYQLVEKKGTPGRLKRFCCEVLKEKSGIGQYFFDGSRADESTKRMNYEPEQCDTRSFMKGCIHYYPILYWTEAEVWEYINKYNLPYSKYYDEPYNLKRHGCVGCPLAGSKQMIIEYRMFPSYAKRMVLALDRYMKAKPHTAMAKAFSDGYEAFYFYINDLSISEFKQLKTGLFGFDAAEIIKKEIYEYRNTEI